MDSHLAAVQSFFHGGKLVTTFGFNLPGGRGVAYSRYDLVTPREFRFTTMYSF